MFRNDGTYYILESVVSTRKNSLHSKVVNRICEPITFEVGESGFFLALFEDGEWHTIITTPIERIEMQNGYNSLVVHTKNSVYSFEKASDDVILKAEKESNYEKESV